VKSVIIKGYMSMNSMPSEKFQ